MTNIRRSLLAPYHYAFAVLAVPRYRFPARRLTVIGITGTKGKSTVAEMLYSILTAAGHETALASTIRFVIGKDSKPNLFKMTMPGRGFIQKFLADALKKGCTHAIVEITSEAALQYRHLGLQLDSLIFTNLQREHIESHGGIEEYFRAKLAIGKSLVNSPKRPRYIIANADDARGAKFLELPVEKSVPFSIADATDVQVSEDGVSFLYNGTHFSLSHPGSFSILNALASIKMSEALGVSLDVCSKALKDLSRISGRVDRIQMGQDFLVVVDYAHTPDSLQALYDAFPNRRKICVLGNTGGGRDTWKRPEMGRIADEACEKVILTNEDPYDESPQAIVEAMARGMKRVPEIILDRREAIRYALASARTNDAVLISGKGTDPFIMGPKGRREVWSDVEVVSEEQGRLISIWRCTMHGFS